MTATETSNLINFFSGQTTNVTTNAVICPFNTGVLKISGTWNGATVQLQTSTPGSTTFVPVTDANGNALTWTQNTQVTIQNIVWDDQIQAVLANAGASTNLNCTLQRI